MRRPLTGRSSLPSIVATAPYVRSALKPTSIVDDLGGLVLEAVRRIKMAIPSCHPFIV